MGGKGTRRCAGPRLHLVDTAEVASLLGGSTQLTSQLTTEPSGLPEPVARPLPADVACGRYEALGRVRRRGGPDVPLGLAIQPLGTRPTSSIYIRANGLGGTSSMHGTQNTKIRRVTSVDLCAAIRNRKLISFVYDGLPRIVQPAAYGSHATTGSMKLRGYQVGGASSSGSLPQWRLFSVDKMESPSMLDETFSDSPPGYSPGDQHLNVICEL